MLIALLFILGSDFPISADVEAQQYPKVVAANDQFYVFWEDLRFYPSDRATMAARVTPDGTILDPDGVLMMRDKTVLVDAAYDSIDFLVVVQDSC
jgi:hypothetical protein